MLLSMLIVFAELLSASEQYYYQDNQKIILAPYHDRFTQRSDVDYYKNSKNLILGVTDKLIIKTRGDIDIVKYLDTFKLIVLKKLDTTIYLLKTQNKSLTIDIANKLNEYEDVIYAHPDFIKKRVLR